MIFGTFKKGQKQFYSLKGALTNPSILLFTPKGISFMRVKRIEDEYMSRPITGTFYGIFLQGLLVKLLV